MENFLKRLERDYPNLYKQVQEGLNNPTTKELTEAAVKQIMAEEAANKAIKPLIIDTSVEVEKD